MSSSVCTRWFPVQIANIPLQDLQLLAITLGISTKSPICLHSILFRLGSVLLCLCKFHKQIKCKPDTSDLHQILLIEQWASAQMFPSTKNITCQCILCVSNVRGHATVTLVLIRISAAPSTTSGHWSNHKKSNSLQHCTDWKHPCCPVFSRILKACSCKVHSHYTHSITI